jgi:hypothetical protein
MWRVEDWGLVPRVVNKDGQTLQQASKSKIASDERIGFEIKARNDEKADHTRKYSNIFRRLATVISDTISPSKVTFTRGPWKTI